MRQKNPAKMSEDECLQISFDFKFFLYLYLSVNFFCILSGRRFCTRNKIFEDIDLGSEEKSK